MGAYEGNRFQRLTDLVLLGIRKAFPSVPLWHVSRNVIILLVSTLAVNVISIPFIAFLARALGVEGFGKYSVALTFAMISVMVIDMGTGKLLTREISRGEAAESAVIGASIFPKPFLFAITLVGGMLAGRALGYSGMQISAIGLGIGIAGMMAMTVAARAVFHAHQRMEYDAIGLLAERVVTIACAVVAVKLGFGLLGVLVAVLLGNVTDALLSWIFVRRRFIPVVSIKDHMQVWTYLRMGFPLFLAAFFSTLYLRANVLMVDRILGSHAAGWFNAALQINFLAIYVPQMLSLALFPVISRLAHHDTHALEITSRKGAWAMAFSGTLIAAFIFLVADWLIHLVYSAQFVPSIGVLRILAVGLPFTFTSSILALVLVATNRQATVGRATIIVTAINIGLNLIFIPIFGLNGSAYVAVITEVTLMAQYAFAVALPKRIV